MKKLLINQVARSGLVLCLWLVFPIQRGAAQFVELTAEIETIRWSFKGENEPPAVHTKSWTTNNQPVCQYRAALPTNVLDWNFPLEFYLVQYRPAGTSGWELHLTAKGKVTAIGVGTKPQIANWSQ